MQSIRTLVVAAVATLSLTALAEADTRIFIIDNSDGYGIDRCLAAGAPCGERMAVAWCRSHDYSRAIDFGRVAETALTPARAAPPAACTGPLCPEAVAITCSR
ncbi:hypothetical protein [Xanthobacter versatilis]|uniref:hypothetical protein n=1 Tax=Xanthobacter autotrophicus (strain ATCC BAA-1158 / Py2) TaxID=78245 RepID=UPI00372705A4